PSVMRIHETAQNLTRKTLENATAEAERRRAGARSGNTAAGTRLASRTANDQTVTLRASTTLPLILNYEHALRGSGTVAQCQLQTHAAQQNSLTLSLRQRLQARPGRDRGTARATLGKGLAVSAFPLYVPV